MTRKWTPWELRFITEWLAHTFGEVEFRTNVRLGEIQPRNPRGQFAPDELRALGVWRRFVDALVFLPDRVLLVEAVLRADPGKLSQLDLYARLFPTTPELADYAQSPLQKILLYIIEDPVVNLLAKEHDILPVQYTPSFFDEWFATLRPRHGRAPYNNLSG